MRESLDAKLLNRPSINNMPSLIVSPSENTVEIEDDVLYASKKLNYLCCVSLMNTCISSTTMAAVEDIEQMFAAFGQGLDLSRTQISLSILLLSRFYEYIPR